VFPAIAEGGCLASFADGAGGSANAASSANLLKQASPLCRLLPQDSFVRRQPRLASGAFLGFSHKGNAMVGHAFVLTASLLTGQTGDYQVVSGPQQNCNCNKNQNQQVQTRPTMFNSGNRPILNRIANLFGGNKQNQEVAAESAPDYYRRMPTTSTNPQVVTSEPPLFEKTVEAPAARPDSVKPTNHQSGPALVNKTSPLKAEFAGKVGHEGDFSWVTGQIEQEKGQWVIYFATTDTVDRYNGRLVLQPQGELRGAHSGDLVSAHGSVAQSGGIAVYRATRIDLIERQ
jgi:hypothetical protein